MITIFIVDDHQIYRDGLCMLFRAADDIDVIGEAASGDEAMAKLATITPSLILMDVQMPGENGIDLTRRIKRIQPNTPILMLTMFEDDQSVFSAMRAGACGYMLKGLNHIDMLHSVRTAAGGGAVFSPSIASRMASFFEQIRPDNSMIRPPALSHREKEVLTLMAAGHDNQTIAERLTLTSKTVRNYVSQIMKQLAVDDRTDAGHRAREIGIL